MKTVTATLLALGVFTLVACDDNEPIGENRLEEIEEAAEEAEDVAEDLADRAGDTAEDAADELEDTIDEPQ